MSLNNLLENDNCAIILGNGFSMNFDTGFGDLHSRLYESHKILVRDTSYYSKSKNANLNKKRKQGYENVLKKMKYIKEKDFYQIFEDGLLFAESIVACNDMEEWLNKVNANFGVASGFGPFFDCTKIVDVGSSKGVGSINIEYWPTLIYLYYVLNINTPSDYTFPVDNSFVQLIKDGEVENIQMYDTPQPILDTHNNGFNTYYKMLYSLAIFNKGKAIGYGELDLVKTLNIKNITDIMDKAKIILSLNYDHIVEKVLNIKNVTHLHGTYSFEDYTVFYQKSSHSFNGRQVNFSTILIGDFLCNKTHFAITASRSKSNIDGKFLLASEVIEKNILEKNISNVIIFGMNICNDQDILRYIMLAFEKAQVENPTITYCYFTCEEKEEFFKQYDQAISFSKEVNEYCKKINIKELSSKEILNLEFYL